MQGLRAFNFLSAAAVVILSMGGCPQPAPQTAVLGEQETAEDLAALTGEDSTPTTGQPPSIGDITVTAALVQGQSSMIVLSCIASDSDGMVQSVMADLSAVGGPSAQAMSVYGTLWTWSGLVTPTVTGPQTIAFTATDQSGMTRTTPTIVQVATTSQPAEPPSSDGQSLAVTNVTVTGALIQGPCDIALSCTASSTDGSVSSVAVDLSQMGGPSRQALTNNGSQWTWSGTVAPATSGTKTITFTASNSNGSTGTASASAGVAAYDAKYADWLFLMPSKPVPDIQAIIRGIKTAKFRVVLLCVEIWDWDRQRGNSCVLTESQVKQLVGALRSHGITVGFHCLAPASNRPGWLPIAIPKLTALGAKIVYADGDWPDEASEADYQKALRSVIGPDGVMLSAWYMTKYCDGYGTIDQGDPEDTYYWSRPREYADWRLDRLQSYRLDMPTKRLELGWIGEHVFGYETPVVTWPLSDYEYVWRRARQAGFPITYRTTMESMARQGDQRLQLIGTMNSIGQAPAYANRNWSCLAMSSDGTKLAAAAYGGRLYASADSGITWTERRPAGDADKNWSCLAMSADGTKLTAAVYGGRLYTSADSGTTWTERRPAGDANKYWEQLGTSSDGTNLVARVAGLGLYRSSNSGATWTESQLPGNADAHICKSWGSIAVSSSGTNLIATSRGMLCTSTNSGATWTQRIPEAGRLGKSCVAMSTNGTSMIAATWGGRLYRSANAGASWAEIKPTGDKNEYWQSAAMSSDGTTILTAVWGGRLRISTNSGTTWTELQPAGNVDRHWKHVAMSGSGTRIIATDGDMIYTSADSGATWATRQPGSTYYDM